MIFNIMDDQKYHLPYTLDGFIVLYVLHYTKL